MADAPPTLPAWWPEAAVSLATAIAARLGWLLRSERRQKATDRRGTAAESVIAEIDRRRLRLPEPWVDEVRREASTVSAAQMRIHEDAVRVHGDPLGELRPRVSALEQDRARQDERFDRMERALDATQRTTQETALLLARIAGRLGVEE